MKRKLKTLAVALAFVMVSTGCGANNVKLATKSSTEAQSAAVSSTPAEFVDFLNDTVVKELNNSGSTTNSKAEYLAKYHQFLILSGLDGIEDIANAANSGNEKAIDFWNKLEDSMTAACKNVYKTAQKSCGKKYGVTFSVYDNDSDSGALLTVCNGVIIDDAVS